jgi:hypothetical protein
MLIAKRSSVLKAQSSITQSLIRRTSFHFSGSSAVSRDVLRNDAPENREKCFAFS